MINRKSKVVSRGTNDLHLPRGFHIGVPLEVLLIFLELDTLGCTLRVFKKAHETTRWRMWFLGAPMKSPGPMIFKPGSGQLLTILCYFNRGPANY